MGPLDCPKSGGERPPLLAAGLGAAALARAVGADLGGRLAVFSVCAAGGQATPDFGVTASQKPPFLSLRKRLLQCPPAGCRAAPPPRPR